MSNFDIEPVKIDAVKMVAWNRVPVDAPPDPWAPVVQWLNEQAPAILAQAEEVTREQ
jgi:hypothetical protein